MNMTEPCSTGIGGDMFCLYYDASTGKVSAMNGSGRAGAKCTLDTIRAELGLAEGQPGKIPMDSVHAVTVPGAPAGWVDTVDRFGSGRLTMEQILAPAIELGEKGYPVSELTAYFWQRAETKMRRASPNFAEWLKADPAAPDGVRAPQPGDIMKNPHLARTFRTLAKEGKKGFYTGRIAEELVKVCRDLGGHLELDDLAHHLDVGTEPVEPISLKFRGQGLGRGRKTKRQSRKRDADGDIKPASEAVVMPSSSNGHKGAENGGDGGEGAVAAGTGIEIGNGNGNGNGYDEAVDDKEEVDDNDNGDDDDDEGLELWEHPPNGQGIVALMALGILQELEREGTIPTFGPQDFNTAPYLHAVIESLRIAFADASWFVTEPDPGSGGGVPTREMISRGYLAGRARLFDPTRASGLIRHGDPGASPALQSSDTVLFCVSDAWGNAISFINSNYGGFGTCIIPRGCGFTLQNRGANFSLEPDHPNVLSPRKRPYHTIIPGLVTNLPDGSLHSVFGVMGGFMQPQGHVQTLLGQVVGGLSPQQALDAPRICIGAGMPDDGDVYDRTVLVEEGMPQETVEGLRRLGHQVDVVDGMARATFGRGQIIRYTVDSVDGTGLWSAGSDLRGDGAAYPA